MLVPVLCITCGYPIGDVEDVFKILRNTHVKAILSERGTAPTQAAVDSRLQLDMTEILEELCIESDCCRKSLISATIFDDEYK